ncbi:MAG TPA: NERD domain-containing protein [Asanoa sp.]
MSKYVEIFWGEEPEYESEKQFLARVEADLNAQGVRATILANFHTRRSSRQIDFFVVTPNHACHVELKSFSGVLRGGTNGSWSAVKPDGTHVDIEQGNPYTQALTAKFAISDDMNVFARDTPGVPRPSGGKRFYTQFDCVVCVFPNLAAGSEVPSDYKVKTLGYPDFLKSIVSPGPRPQWSGDHWTAFITNLALVRAAATTGQPADADSLIKDYGDRFKDFHSPRLHELVATPATLDGTMVSSVGLVDRLIGTTSAQILGPAGSGKSHLAKHIMLAALSHASVPILARAGLYGGRLSALLDRSVAPFVARTANELLKAAAATGSCHPAA